MPRAGWGFCLCQVLLTLAIAQASTQTTKMLVLMQDPVAQRDAYSSFFSGLGERVQLEFKGTKESSIKLKEYDQWLYDHLAIFAPKAEGKCV